MVVVVERDQRESRGQERSTGIGGRSSRRGVEVEVEAMSRRRPPKGGGRSRDKTHRTGASAAK